MCIGCSEQQVTCCQMPRASATSRWPGRNLTLLQLYQQQQQQQPCLARLAWSVSRRAKRRRWPTSITDDGLMMTLCSGRLANLSLTRPLARWYSPCSRLLAHTLLKTLPYGARDMWCSSITYQKLRNQPSNRSLPDRLQSLEVLN